MPTIIFNYDVKYQIKLLILSKMYDLVADVDVHAWLYVFKGFLDVSSPGRSKVTGITVSL